MFKISLSQMPTLAFVIFALASSTSWAQSRLPSRTMQRPSLFSQTSIEKAWKTASQRQQPMLVMFTSNNCMFCKKMLAETYGHPAIKQMLAGRTQTVLAHADNYEALIKRLGIRGFPSTVLLSPKGEVLDFMEGYVAPKDFAKRVTPILQAQLAQARKNQASATQARAVYVPSKTTGR